MRPLLRTTLALAATFVIVGSAAVVIWKIHISKHPVDTATVYAGDLAAVAIAVTLLLALGAWWWKGERNTALQASTPSQVTSAADRLAEMVADRWRQEATRRRIITPAPATVRWSWAADDLTAPRQEVTIPPAPGTGPPSLPHLKAPGKLLESGVVTRLHDEVYARLPHGRLVLLGGPGAGKTGAMILLLLAALEHRISVSSDKRAQVPVPVWLTLGSWDPVTMTLRQWAVYTMNRDYPALRARDYGPDAVTELLRGGQVALFLDGLDEMPEELRIRALQRADEEARGLRVVITSRPDEYRSALHVGTPANIAVIELHPVQPDVAATYLLRDQVGPTRQRWELVAAYLRQHPDSIAAQALDNPLNLSLARDVYVNQDPAVLIDPDQYLTADEIRENLIEQILTTAYPDEKQRAEATQWLTWIAHYMGTNRDLVWWNIPTWVTPWQLRLTRGLLAFLVAVIGIVLVPTLRNYSFAVGGVSALGALSFPAIFGFLAGSFDWLRRGPAMLVPRWPHRQELGVIALFVLGAAILGGVASLFPADPQGHTQASVVGFSGALGLTFGVAFMLPRRWRTPVANSTSATPIGTYQADLRSSKTIGLLVTFAAWAGFLVASWLGEASVPLWYIIVWGLGFGLAVGLCVVLMSGEVVQVKLTEFLLACQRRGKIHFLRLLEDASNRQLLRQAGAVYQFRHAALQDHIATTYISTLRNAHSKDKPC